MRKQAFRVVIVIVVLAGSVTAARAQVGVPNPTTLPPDKFINTSKDPDFRNLPHPLNNPHPVEPWDPMTTASPWGAVLQVIDIPASPAEVPMEVPQPGSLPSIVDNVAVTLPGYRVVETTTGYTVAPHWSVRPRANGVYYWTWIPLQFVPK